jgi:hypothetical protein
VVQSLADGHVTASPVLDRQARLIGVVCGADVLQALAEAPEDGGGESRRRPAGAVYSAGGRRQHTLHPGAVAELVEEPPHDGPRRSASQLPR